MEKEAPMLTINSSVIFLKTQHQLLHDGILNQTRSSPDVKHLP
jgi:hypothetical protein